MTHKTETRFICDGCEAETLGGAYISAPLNWRYLNWGSGYMDNSEKREAHFCPGCWPSRLKALDILLETRGPDVFA